MSPPPPSSPPLLLQVPYSDIVIPMSNLPPNPPSNVPVTTVVMAFRAGLYSDPMYVASANTTLTTGYGFVQALSMMLSFSEWRERGGRLCA